MNITCARHIQLPLALLNVLPCIRAVGWPRNSRGNRQCQTCFGDECLGPHKDRTCSHVTNEASICLPCQSSMQGSKYNASVCHDCGLCSMHKLERIHMILFSRFMQENMGSSLKLLHIEVGRRRWHNSLWVRVIAWIKQRQLWSIFCFLLFCLEHGLRALFCLCFPTAFFCT